MSDLSSRFFSLVQRLERLERVASDDDRSHPTELRCTKLDGSVLTVEAKGSWKIRDVKTAIQKKLNVPGYMQDLVWGTTMLSENEKTLHELFGQVDTVDLQWIQSNASGEELKQRKLAYETSPSDWWQQQRQFLLEDLYGPGGAPPVATRTRTRAAGA
eukprot:gnl/TRDRNA2_/TRDRNA2_29877_c0_seq1.p1 gnl/TRDRNA2_/TRDRNA2_29877_c0~~gnl/TRDRNA2_/TRDRNA2_29877_c0_seq1.p1  ORF type:complete len:158 (+),score=24.22 gnl/TRDRNA2_/TRDRNA2_29877_c0_seq1:77-550(+)